MSMKDTTEELAEESTVAADEGAETIAETEEREESYGDLIIEEFSAASTITKITGLTHISSDIVSYFVCAIYLIVGVLCVAITETVTSILPYAVGGMMIIIGVAQFVFALIHKEYREVKTNKTVTSLIAAALGVMIIVQELDAGNDSAITFISVVWGILGLFEGAHAFNRAIARISRSERSVFYILKGIVELVVAFYLLYDPQSHEAHFVHIVVFGINLIFDSITMFPPIKKFIYKY